MIGAVQQRVLMRMSGDPNNNGVRGNDKAGKVREGPVG